MITKPCGRNMMDSALVSYLLAWRTTRLFHIPCYRCMSRNCFQLITSIPRFFTKAAVAGITEDAAIAVTARGAVRDRSEFLIIVATVDNQLAYHPWVDHVGNQCSVCGAPRARYRHKTAQCGPARAIAGIESLDYRRGGATYYQRDILWRQRRIIANDQYRQVIFQPELHVNVEQICRLNNAPMCVSRWLSGTRNCRATVDLRSQFDLCFLGLDLPRN